MPLIQSSLAATKLLDHFRAKAFILPYNGGDIAILKTPTEFFERLKDGIRGAKQDITIASLYAGTAGGQETEFVDALSSAIQRPATRPSITMLLDALRSTRPSKDQAGQVTSTAQMLSKSLLEGSPNGGAASIHLFHTPALRGVLKRLLPARVNEVVGVCHLKAFVFDVDVIISGANLSNTYFSMRQDRYYVMRNAGPLASHIRSLVEIVGRYSYKLQPGAELAMNRAGLDPLTAPQAFNQALKSDLEKLFVPGNPTDHSGAAVSEAAAAESAEAISLPAAALSDHVSQAVGGGIHRQAGKINAEYPDLRALHRRLPHLESKAAHDEAANPVIDVSVSCSGIDQGAREAEAEASAESSQQDTWIIPMAQLGSAGLRQDESLTADFLRAAEPGGTLTISTAYLNMARSYERALASIPEVNVEVITASPEANGFYGSKGVSGLIPTAYSQLELHTWRRLQRAWRRRPPSSGQPVARRLLEYKRPGWEFHAKGIWYYPPGESTPIATAIGSPNFGYRSVVRDLEAQFLIITTNPELRKAMAEEVQRLRSHCEEVTEQELVQPERSGTPTVTLAAYLLRGFL